MAAITVGTSEVAVEFPRRAAPFIQNLDGSNAVYWSRSKGVTASNGVEIASGASQQIHLPMVEEGGERLYLVAAGADTDVRVEPAPRNTV